MALPLSGISRAWKPADVICSPLQFKTPGDLTRPPVHDDSACTTALQTAPTRSQMMIVRAMPTATSSGFIVLAFTDFTYEVRASAGSSPTSR